MITLVLIVVSVILLIAYYLRGKHNEAYWRKRNAAFYPRFKSAGILFEFFKNDRALFELAGDVYNEFPNTPAVGMGYLLTPNLLVRDPTNIQYVTTTDFGSFMDRSVEPNSDAVLSNSLAFITGVKWKVIRQSMSPLFTSSKLKLMYYIMDKSAKDFVPYIRNNPELKKGNAFKTLSMFCSAAVAAAVFGITTESVFDSPFLSMAHKASFNTVSQNIKMALTISSSWLTRMLGIRLFSEFEGFFIGAIRKVIEERKKSNTPRHDFGDLCVALQEKGVLRDNESGYEIKPTDEILSAQAFFFFNAGVEPTASTMFNVLVLLGQHPEIQKKLHDEIDEVFEKSEGRLSFDIISGMEYLDMVMNESSRLFPAIGLLGRHCTKDTTLPVGNIKVDKGTTIFIPVFSIQRDEKYYPEPEVFKPERFSRDHENPITEKIFMPFGKGNRMCIGQRFALIQAKAGIVHLLRNFSVNTVNQPGKKIGFKKDFLVVRLVNVDLEFIDR